jgi:hypothetical protein
VISFARFDRDAGFWEPDTTVETPADIGSLYYTIDDLGYGHLFVVDSTTLWHFGQSYRYDVRDANSVRVKDFALTNYPNPFNSETTIAFSLPSTQRISLTVFDLLGRQTALIAEKSFTAGEHQVRFDASSFSSGIYFIRLQTDLSTVNRKIVLLR